MKVYLGPPGTGKTTKLISDFEKDIANGYSPSDIAYVSFTRAAREEVMKRLGDQFKLTHKELPWVRTIHSTAFKLLGIQKNDVIKSTDYKDFRENFSYEISTFDDKDINEPDTGVSVQRRDDYMMRMLHWGSCRNITDPQAIYKQYPGDMIYAQTLFTPEMFSRFCSDFREFKRQKQVIDFDDMLIEALKTGRTPMAAIAYGDEAQDFSPIQAALFQKWYKLCDKVSLAGDDDQAIYGFSGANPDWLVSMAREHGHEVLAQSHRVPGKPHRLAMSIITQNKNRIAKEYRPKIEQGEFAVLGLSEFPKAITGDCLVLSRNRKFFDMLSSELESASVPYLTEGLGRTSGTERAYSGARAAVLISEARPASQKEVMDLLSFIPSRGYDLLPHGVKTKVENESGSFGLDRLITIGLGDMVDMIQSNGPFSPMIGMSEKDRSYFESLRKQYGEIPEPKVKVTTIHQSKGREADTVVICPDMNHPSYMGMIRGDDEVRESENRVAYVAITRAKKRLIILRPETDKYFDYGM